MNKILDEEEILNAFNSTNLHHPDPNVKGFYFLMKRTKLDIQNGKTLFAVQK